MYKKRSVGSNYYLPTDKESLAGERLLSTLVLAMVVPDVLDKMVPDSRLGEGKILE